MQQGREPHTKRFGMAEMLRAVSLASARHPKFALSWVLLVSLACVVAAACFLQFKIDRSDLIDPSAEFHQRWLAYVRSFGDSSDMVVVVEADKPQRIKDVLDRKGVLVSYLKRRLNPPSALKNRPSLWRCRLKII